MIKKDTKQKHWNVFLLVGVFILLSSTLVCANFGVGFTSKLSISMIVLDRKSFMLSKT